MAAQGMIRPEGSRFRVVFPYGGQEYAVHSVESAEEAHTVLHCLMAWAMADLQRCLEQSAAGVHTPLGSPQQLVQELQACVGYCYSRDIDAGEPASCWLMEAAAAEGHASVAQQLLAWDRPRALANLDAGEVDEMPLHLAALGGHAAVFRLLLAAAPEAATTTVHYEAEDIIDVFEDEDVVYGGWSLMHSAAHGDSTAVIEALLEVQPAAAGWTSDHDHSPLHEACRAGCLEAARALLKAGPATATAADSKGAVPLHWAAAYGANAVVELLLQAAPSMATATNVDGEVPLHSAAAHAQVAAAELLLATVPEAALMEDFDKQRPFHGSLAYHRIFPGNEEPRLSIARLLMPVSGLSPAQLLDFLASKPKAQPLYADLAAHSPLSAAEWQRVPTPCAGLGRALPAVLARSDAEARQLVQHLPVADRQHLIQRLPLAALCLGRAQRRHHAFLPAPLVRAILAQCLL